MFLHKLCITNYSPNHLRLVVGCSCWWLAEKRQFLDCPKFHYIHRLVARQSAGAPPAAFIFSAMAIHEKPRDDNGGGSGMAGGLTEV